MSSGSRNQLLIRVLLALLIGAALLLAAGVLFALGVEGPGVFIFLVLAFGPAALGPYWHLSLIPLGLFGLARGTFAKRSWKPLTPVVFMCLFWILCTAPYWARVGKIPHGSDGWLAVPGYTLLDLVCFFVGLLGCYFSTVLLIVNVIADYLRPAWARMKAREPLP